MFRRSCPAKRNACCSSSRTNRRSLRAADWVSAEGKVVTMVDAHEPTEEPNDRAVYIISVAAELAGVHPQTLRIYERKGLVRPKRTQGNTRRYSNRDIQLLQQIQDLTQEGINLAGVKAVIALQAEVDALPARTE